MFRVARIGGVPGRRWGRRAGNTTTGRISAGSRGLHAPCRFNLPARSYLFSRFRGARKRREWFRAWERCFMIFPYEEFDLSGVRTYPLASRKSKATRRGLRAAGRRPAAPSRGFVDSLPNMLAAADFKAVVARRSSTPGSAGGGIVWGLGAHVIKTGLGAGADRSDGARLRLGDRDQRRRRSSTTSRSRSSGATSEDVDEALGPGRFGMAEETGRLLNAAINDGVARAASASARRSTAFLARTAAAVRARSVLAAARAARHSGDRARRDRHRHHPHAPGGVRRGARRGQPARLPLFRRRTSRGSSAACT